MGNTVTISLSHSQLLGIMVFLSRQNNRPLSEKIPRKIWSEQQNNCIIAYYLKVKRNVERPDL